MSDLNPSDPLPSPPPADEPKKPSGWFAKFLAVVEWLGNCLPHPVTLFFLFAVAIVILSGLAAYFDLTVLDPRPEGSRGRAADGIIRVNSLMSGEGVRWMFQNLVSNFVGFAPLGTVLVALLGVGVAERSGLLSAIIRKMILAAPPSLVTVVIVFGGVLSNTASEMGYVVIIPLAAAVFYSIGRHPLAGLAAAFAGVSGGYSANLVIGTVDPLLAGITQEAARYIDPAYEVHAAVNWYFMAVSVPMITVIGTWVTAKIVEPRLGKYDPALADESVEKNPKLEQLTSAEVRGLKWAGLATLVGILFIVYLAGPQATAAVGVDDLAAVKHDQLWTQVDLDAAPKMDDKAVYNAPVAEGLGGFVNKIVLNIPGWGVLRDPVNNALMPSPFLRSVVAMIFIFFILPGFVYGRVAGTMKNDEDIINAMAHQMNTMGLYIVLVFFAAQFVAFFGYTNLGQILAVLGADAIRAMNLDNPLVFIPFILMCCFVNLMLGSASAQWAVTAPIFVPMLMTVGYTPEVIQAAYRIGDSTTNIITPMMSYFGLILAFAVKYDRKLGIGTLVATMLPYSICFLLGWIVLFYTWVFLLGIPVGPGTEILYTPGG